MSSNNDNSNAVVPDAIPPFIIALECPCSSADFRSADNSKWTNILREPITVQKGSEIRCSYNFIDQRGIDADIIQFTNSTNTQNNCHTLLTQTYITNSGYNGLTTSYDYISRQNTPITILDPGEQQGGVDFFATFTSDTGSGTGLKGNIKIAVSGIRPQNINITNGGMGYINGDTFSIESNPAGDPFEGYCITDDVGGIAKLVFTKPVSRNAAPSPPVIVWDNNTQGVDFAVSLTFTTGGYYPGIPFFQGGKTDVSRGTGYKRNDTVYIQANSAGATIPTAYLPYFRINQIYSGQGQVIQEAYFDQGYNYEKVPLQRWSQIYDVNQNFSYGNNYAKRTFTKADGQSITINTQITTHSNDTCVSSATMILPREDEFAPGIFHKEFSEFQSSTGGNQAQISLFAPIANFSSVGGTTFGLGWYNEGIVLTADNYTYEQNGVNVLGNCLNCYPEGSSIKLLFDDLDNPTYEQKTYLDDHFNNLIAGTYYVKTTARNSTTATLYLSQYQKPYIGAGTAFEARIGAVPVPAYPNGTTKVQLVYSTSGDGNGPPTLAPEIYITVVAGVIDAWDSQDSSLNQGTGNRPGMIYTIQGYASTDRFICLKTDSTGGWNAARALSNFNNSDLIYNDGTGNRPCTMFIIPANNYVFPNDSIDNQGNRLGFRYATQTPLFSNLPATIRQQGITSNLPTDNDVGITDYVSNGLYRKSGNLDSTQTNFLTSEATLANHDTNTQLYCTDFNDSSVDEILSYGAGQVILASDPGNSTFQNAAGFDVLTINIAAWAALDTSGGYNFKTLPLNTTLEMTPTISGVVQWYNKGSLTVGNAYTTANNLTVSGGSGTGMIVNITATAGNIDALPGGVKIISPGQGYSIDDVITIVQTGATGGTFTITGLNTVQMETGGFYDYDATNYHILIKCLDVQNNYLSYFPILAANQAEMGGVGGYVNLIDIPYKNYEGSTVDGIYLSYTIPLYFNNQITFQWIDNNKNLLNNGAIVSTGPQNFFGTGDVNYSTMRASGNNFISSANQSLQGSYNTGGYYFLSRFTGTMTTKDNDNAYQYVNTDINRFNNYGCFLPFGQLPPQMYDWRVERNDPFLITPLAYTEANGDYNNNTAYTSASNFWGYQPLYRQKSLVINKNFCVASDVSGIWTREAHSLLGAINPITGEEYIPANQTPILQNEFIFPVYGSNNIILPTGEYLPDMDRYYYSQGLEPGHVVGKCYLEETNDWLAAPIMSSLPYDTYNSQDLRFYYVFFRTAFTFIRGYDPLANNNGSPVFTPLITVNLTSSEIGNVNDSTATPAVSGKVALDGSPLMNAGATPKPTAYELGDALGNNSAVRFGTQQYYPIYYLDERNKSLYPKAKISQYVGSQNIALAFATDISAFTFQYLHSPYTSPFVDGQGGQEAVRVFFGNRRNGIFNHDSLSGLNVINYCRPEFPRGVFSYEEVNENVKTINEYPWGINPLVSVGQIGQRFMNKIGFMDPDIGITNHLLDSSLGKLGFSYSQSALVITDKMDQGITLAITNGGTGYVAGTAVATTTITGVGSGMTITYDITAGVITSAYVITPGDGYVSTDTIRPVDATSGNNAVLTLTVAAAPATTIYVNTTTFNATTGTDIDSSDSILTEVQAVETLPGLDSHNQKFIPSVGSKNYIIRRWGDFIFYPYGLNTDTNSFQDKSVVRFDNASSTYGAVGGNLLSNSHKGLGIPNTIGSTYNCDQNTVPRTLNPDCELYTAYTIACQSNYIIASQLPAKLPNGYLVIVSSLMKETNFYMNTAGWVNCLSVVNKTFLTGDFILSQGEFSFYCQDDFVLSEITTEIKDSAYNSPTVLGDNSCVIYQITNYNPRPEKALPTIEQVQEQDITMQKMIQEHIDYLEGKTNTSDLQNLESSFHQIGISILQGGSSMADVIQAMKNQIDYHDLPNLNRRQLAEFLQTDTGKQIQANAQDIAVMKQQISSVVATREDLRQLAATRPPGSAAAEQLERSIEENIRNVQRRATQIRERIPQNFFTPSLPPEEQMPTLTESEKVNLKSLPETEFIDAAERRLTQYQDYRTSRIKEGRNPLTFEEFQHFNYDNILTPQNDADAERIRKYDPDLLPRLQDYDLGGTSKSVANVFDDLDEPNATMELSRLARSSGERAYGYASAYEAIPDFMRPRASESSYNENLKRFTDEIKGGSAELTGLQEDILRHSGIAYRRPIRGDKLAIPHSEGVRSERFITGDDFKFIRQIPSLAITAFHSEEQKKEALDVLMANRGEFERLYPEAKGRGRPQKPSKEISEQRRALINKVKEDVSGIRTRPVVNAPEEVATLRSSKVQAADPNAGVLKRQYAREEDSRKVVATASVNKFRQSDVRDLARDNLERYHQNLREVRRLKEEDSRRRALASRAPEKK